MFVENHLLQFAYMNCPDVQFLCKLNKRKTGLFLSQIVMDDEKWIPYSCVVQKIEGASEMNHH